MSPQKSSKRTSKVAPSRRLPRAPRAVRKRENAGGRFEKNFFPALPARRRSPVSEPGTVLRSIGPGSDAQIQFVACAHAIRRAAPLQGVAPRPRHNRVRRAASAARSGPDHSKSVPHSRSLHGTPREAQPAFSHQPAKRKAHRLQEGRIAESQQSDLLRRCESAVMLVPAMASATRHASDLLTAL